MLLPALSLDTEQVFHMALFSNIVALVLTASFSLIQARSNAVIKLRVALDGRRASAKRSGAGAATHAPAASAVDEFWLSTCLCCLLASSRRFGSPRLTRHKLASIGCPQFRIMKQYKQVVRVLLFAFVVRVGLLCIAGGAGSIPDWFRGAIYAPEQVSSPERLVSPLYYAIYWFVDELASNSLMLISIRPTPSRTAVRQSLSASGALACLACSLTSIPYVISRLQLVSSGEDGLENNDTWQLPLDLVMLSLNACVYLTIMSMHGFALHVRRSFWPYILLQAAWRVLYAAALSDGVYGSAVGVMVVALKTCALPMVVIACLADDSREWRDIEAAISKRVQGETLKARQRKRRHRGASLSLGAQNTDTTASEVPVASFHASPRGPKASAAAAAASGRDEPVAELVAPPNAWAGEAGPMIWLGRWGDVVTLGDGRRVTRERADELQRELDDLNATEESKGLSVDMQRRLQELLNLQERLAELAAKEQEGGLAATHSAPPASAEAVVPQLDSVSRDTAAPGLAPLAATRSAAAAAPLAATRAQTSRHRLGGDDDGAAEGATPALRAATDSLDIIGSLDSLMLGDVIGSGSFASVRMALSVTGVTVAVKTMHESTSRLHAVSAAGLEEAKEMGAMDDDRYVERVAMRLAAEREASACSLFRTCRYIVTCYGVADLGESHVGVVFEYCDGGTLSTALRSPGLMTVARRLRYGIQVAKAVQRLHDAKTVHCDIKTDNIFLKSTGRHDFGTGIVDCQAVLGDFGLATKLADGDGPAVDESGQILGTPFYMSPEHFDKSVRSPTMAMDIWALGNVLYELWTLNPTPWYEEYNEAVRRMGAPRPAMKLLVMGKHKPKMTNTDSNVGKAFRGLVHDCLARNPDDRPTAWEVVDELLHIQRKLRKCIDKASPFAQQDMDWDPFCRDLDDAEID